MKLTEQQLRKLLAVRKILLKRIEKLKKQIRYYENILQIVDNIIRSSSIMTADKILEKHIEEQKLREKCVEILERENNIIELKLKFSIKKEDSLFRKLVKEKLDKFKHEDLERVREGEIDSEYMFDYEINTDENGIIKVIRLWNCDTKRLNSIVRSIEILCTKIERGGATLKP